MMPIDVKKYVNPDSKDTPIVVYQKDVGVIMPLEVIPSTETQVIYAPDSVNGYNPVTVSNVTSAIDSNIQEGNIKEGVSILGVEGTNTIVLFDLEATE